MNIQFVTNSAHPRTGEIRRVRARDTSGIAPLTTPEIDLIVLASRRHGDDATRDRIAYLSRQDLDWPSVLAQAARHGVIPLLYFNLRSAEGVGVPSAVMDDLGKAFRASAHHNL